MEEVTEERLIKEIRSRRLQGKSYREIEREFQNMPGYAIGRTKIGELAKKAEEEEGKYDPIDWGNLTDFEWKTWKSQGLPAEAVNFLLQVHWQSKLTVADAKLCWKLKQAAPDIPVSHVAHLIDLVLSRSRLEKFNSEEENDNSDLWGYLASHRWGSREEDILYLSRVASNACPYLNPLPPNLRPPELSEIVCKAYGNLEILTWPEIDLADERRDQFVRRLWQVSTGQGLKNITMFLLWLPSNPWDPRRIQHENGVRQNRKDNLLRMQALQEQENEFGGSQ